jgi:hypothetical protein
MTPLKPLLTRLGIILVIGCAVAHPFVNIPFAQLFWLAGIVFFLIGYCRPLNATKIIIALLTTYFIVKFQLVIPGPYDLFTLVITASVWSLVLASILILPDLGSFYFTRHKLPPSHR